MSARAPAELPRYSLGEEIANAVTHGVGALLAIAGLAVLCAFAAMILGLLAHGIGRIVARRRQRKD